MSKRTGDNLLYFDPFNGVNCSCQGTRVTPECLSGNKVSAITCLEEVLRSGGRSPPLTFHASAFPRVRSHFSTRIPRMLCIRRMEMMANSR